MFVYDACLPSKEQEKILKVNKIEKSTLNIGHD